MEPQTAYELSARTGNQRLVLSYLSVRDEPWLEALLAECARFVGRKQSELHERLREPLGVPAPRRKLRAAAQVLERLLPENPQRSPLPREVRAQVFAAAAQAAAQLPTSRAQVLEAVARQLAVDAATVELALFADLAGQRRIAALPPDLCARRLALLANQALVHTFLKRALRVRLRAWGNAHALVRQARRLGLICIAGPLEPQSHDDSPGVALDISGPFSLFRKTELYGRALASLLPHAARCRHFELEAECLLARTSPPATLSLSPADPIFAASDPAAFDSRVATRLRRDLERRKCAWHCVSEPAAIADPSGLHFPDLELISAANPELRWLLEIAGFWTPEYVRQRLAAASAAGLHRFILCVDDARCCGEHALPDEPRIFRYQKRIDVALLLAKLG